MSSQKNGKCLELEENAKIVDMAAWESKANSRGRNNIVNR